MDFRKLITLCEAMSRGEARQIFFTNGVDTTSLDTKQLKTAYRGLMMKHHPDRGGDGIVARQLSVAFGVLEDELKNAAPRDRVTPATNSRGNDFSMDHPRFSHIDYVKWYFEQLTQGVPAQSWTVMNFDGHFFRGTFTIRANADLFPKVSEVMIQWDGHYNSRAILVGTNQMLDRGTIAVISVDGREVKPMVTLDFDSFNRNPANDSTFQNKLPEILDAIADGSFVSQDMLTESTMYYATTPVEYYDTKGECESAISAARQLAKFRQFNLYSRKSVDGKFYIVMNQKTASDLSNSSNMRKITETEVPEPIFKSNWIDQPRSNDFHGNGRGFSTYPGIYLCRTGSNSAYGNHKGGFASHEDAVEFAKEHGLGDYWKITEIK